MSTKNTEVPKPKKNKQQQQQQQKTRTQGVLNKPYIR